MLDCPALHPMFCFGVQLKWEMNIKGKVQRVVKSVYVSITGAVSVWKCPELGIFGNTMFDLLFADDFVGIAEARSAFHSWIDIVHYYNKCWVI